MKTKVSPAIVGLFVMGALVLGLIALFSFGGINFFSKPQRFMVYFDETIHGLDLGSPVKLRGVRVGRVVDINIRFDSKRNKSVAAVACELSRNSITDVKGAFLNVDDRGQLQELIDHGLRAQLGVIGLATGLLYVELDFLDPKAYPAAKAETTDVRMAVVPAVPSAISEFQSSLTEIMADLKRVDFAGLGRELHGLVADVRRQVNAMEVKGLIAEWTKAGQSVNAFANDPQLKATFANLNAAVADLRGVLTKLDRQIEPAGEKLGATLAEAQQALASFNSTALALRRFVDSQQHLGEGASQAMAKFAEAADAVQRLADFLERNPTALLTGRGSDQTP